MYSYRRLCVNRADIYGKITCIKIIYDISIQAVIIVIIIPEQCVLIRLKDIMHETIILLWITINLPAYLS